MLGVAQTAYGACTSDGRQPAWTERAPILRDREGVKTLPRFPSYLKILTLEPR